MITKYALHAFFSKLYHLRLTDCSFSLPLSFIPMHSTITTAFLAMACGLATLQVLDDEQLIERARESGAELVRRLSELREKHSLIKEVRGLGLMIAIEFHEPKERALKVGWRLLHRFERELFAQMIVTALFQRHRVLSQLAGHGTDVLKILPPLIIGEREIIHFVAALDQVLADCRTFPGPLWELGSNFVRHSLRRNQRVKPVMS